MLVELTLKTGLSRTVILHLSRTILSVSYFVKYLSRTDLSGRSTTQFKFT